ncbi:MAG: DUF2589 domain-containing protein [Ferrovibrio sp.]|jgi:hypothetical protein
MADEVTQPFVDLPVKDLIAAPLAAACDAQIDLANAYVKFVRILAYGANTTQQGGQVQTLPMTIERPVIDPTTNSISKSSVTVTPPLLGLVPTPALLIDHVEIDFTMEVKTSVSEKASEDKEFNMTADASFGFGFWKASMHMSGKVSTHRENTRSTDKSAKYEFKVVANQQQQTEGMSKLMDLLAASVEPITLSPPKQ